MGTWQFSAWSVLFKAKDRKVALAYFKIVWHCSPHIFKYGM